MKVCRFMATTAVAIVSILPAGVAMAQATEAAAQGQVVAQEDEASTARGAQLEEIIVTAQRTTQNLQDVPISINAVSASDLTARGITNAFSLGNAVPGLQVTQTGTTTTPYLRGVGSNAANPNNEASVATYIDGIYIAAPYASALSFNNIDRIEVLKGPQGTLFGRNATGGVIQVITRTPKFDPSMDLSLGYGNYDTVDVGAYVTGGLTNTLAADFAVQYKNQMDGFGRDLVRNRDTYLGWEAGIRSKLLWEPRSGTSITLAGDYSRLKNDFLNYVYPPGTTSPIIPAQGYAGRYNTSTDFQAESNTKTYGGSLTVKQDLGFATLVSLSGRRIAEGLNAFDRDGTPLPILHFNSPQSVKNWSQELQLNSNPGGPLAWTVGAFYYDSKAGYVPARLIGLSFGPAPDSELIIRGVQKTESHSVYGQATYEVVERLHVTAGLRYTDEKSKVNWSIMGGPPIKDRTGFEELTWRGAIDYEFIDDAHVYVSYNRGIKSGGFDLLSPGGAPYDPEVLDAYETGLKTELFDRRVRFNVSAFLYKYKDIQVAANPTGVIITTNAAKATVKGIDADFAAAVTSNLRLTGGLGFTSGKFDDFPNPVVYNEDGTQNAGLINARGNRLVRTPKFTANLGATYTIETSIGDFAASGSYYHNSGFFWDVDNRLRAPKYDLFGASVSWKATDGALGVRLWMENLADEHYHTQGVSAQGVGDNVVFGAPRTYGVTLTSHF